MKISCEVIRDLMPLYHDGVCSKQSSDLVKAHLHECRDCQDYYNTMCTSDEIEKEFFNSEQEMKTANSFKDFSKKVLKRAILVVSSVVMIVFILCVALMLWFEFNPNGVDRKYSDIKHYDDNREDFFSKAMQEIWPEHVIPEESSAEYKIVGYYDDAYGYTGYLTVCYDSNTYEQEIERLRQIESTEYIGKYGNNGIDKEIYAIKAYSPEDSKGSHDNGFTYAIGTGVNEITYVELQFPRTAPRKDWKKVIPTDYALHNLTFEYTGLTITDKLIWGMGPIILALPCGFCSYNNIKDKKKRGYLQAVFAVMLIVFGMMTIAS